MSAPAEIWRPVPGSDWYEVSTLGRVRSWKFGRGRHGTIRRAEPRMLSQCLISRGYPAVRLSSTGLQYVHHLVLKAFIGPRPDGFEASHLNGDSADCRLDNLAWESRAANYARRTVHRAATPRKPYRKMTEAEVLDVRSLMGGDKPPTIKTIAQRYGTSRDTISRIISRKSWAHLKAT